MLEQVTPGPDGRVRQELAAAVSPVSDAERESWARLRPGPEVLAAVGAHPVASGAGEELYERIGAAPALEVNMIAAGEPRAIIPAVARAHVSLRLAPAQRAADMGAELERLLRSAAPVGAEVVIDMDLADPALFDPGHPALRLAAGALERACDTAPVFMRLGGTLPLLSVLADRGIATIVSGFVLDADAIHAPNESYRLESLRLGERAARELYLALGELEPA
jgi:acetylornithine deacetylase/succinyl-diaminopimelate desuccinylase-like protein